MIHRGRTRTERTLDQFASLLAETDGHVPVAHGRLIAELCPSAGLHLVEGGGHMLLGEMDEILSSLHKL